MTINLQTGAASGSGGIQNIQDFVGNSTTTLVAPNATNTWTLSGLNSGTLASGASNFTFSGVPSLTGGTGKVTFTFTTGQGVSGTVKGGAGGTNILNLSAYTTAVGVTLSGTSGASGYSGTTSGTPNPTGGFADITQINEPALANTLTLANGVVTTVTINSSLPTNLFNLTVNDGGTSNLAFTNIGTVNGGTGVTNTLISGEATSNVWTISSVNGGNYNDGQSLVFTQFGNLTGGGNTDNFVLAGGTDRKSVV